MTRRTFLSATAYSAAFRNDALRLLESISHMPMGGAGAVAQDDDYWLKVREAFDVETDFLFLNHGGICPSPKVVVDAETRRIKEANRAPSYTIYRKQDHEIDAVRKRLATMFECDPEELAVMPNASQGLFSVIMGAPLSRGDTILTTGQDYPRILTACNQRERREGTRTYKVHIPTVPKSADELSEPLVRAMNDGVKLAVFPQIGYLNGTIFPVAEICKQAAAKGIMTLVDGAHGIGHMPDTAKTLGCDAYACCLHKWMLGPLGSGFLYVKKDRIKDIWSLWPSDENLASQSRKFEQFGTRPTGVLLAIQEALDAHEAIGRDRKGARLETLRQYWTGKLVGHPKIHFNTNLDPQLSRCLVNVSIDGMTGAALSGWLFSKRKIFVTTAQVGDADGIRVSAQIYTTKEELDRLVSALLEAADKGIA